VRAVARVIAVLGAVATGMFLLRSGPHEVDLVYDLSAAPGATRLEVDIRRGAELVRHAEFRVAPGIAPARHALKLPEGEYAVAWRVARPDGATGGVLPLEIHEGGTIVLPLAPP
jgi:hypothetical protein